MYWYDNDRMDYKKDDILQYAGTTRQIKSEINTEKDNYFVLSPKDVMIVDSGYPSYTGGRSNYGNTKSWQNYWNFDPNTYNTTGKLLGSEILAWSDMNNEYDFLTKIFPRAGIVSFKHWNPHNTTSRGAVIETMMRLQYRVKAFGIPTEKISMRY